MRRDPVTRCDGVPGGVGTGVRREAGEIGGEVPREVGGWLRGADVDGEVDPAGDELGVPVVAQGVEARGDGRLVAAPGAHGGEIALQPPARVVEAAALYGGDPRFGGTACLELGDAPFLIDGLFGIAFHPGVRHEALGVEQLADAEATIVAELNGVQGHPVDIGGYYHPDEELVAEAMRPSTTLNAIIEAL